MTVKILLEMLLRDEDTPSESIQSLAHWSGKPVSGLEIPFKPARVLLHDYTGIPAIVDLAAMRAAMQRSGKDPQQGSDDGSSSGRRQTRSCRHDDWHQQGMGGGFGQEREAGHGCPPRLFGGP